MKLKAVNPNDPAPKKEKTPWGSIILIAMVTGAASAVGIKILEYSLQKSKEYNPWRTSNPMMLPGGASGPQSFQNPYSNMAQTQGLPFPPMEAPAIREDGPPKWFEDFRTMHDRQMKAFEQRLGPRMVKAEGDDEAA